MKRDGKIAISQTIEGYVIDKNGAYAERLGHNPRIELATVEVHNYYWAEVNLETFDDFDSTKPGKYRVAYGPQKGSTYLYVEFEIK